MRTIYCFRTFPHNILVLNYKDDCVEITRRYIDYTTKQAIRLFKGARTTLPFFSLGKGIIFPNWLLFSLPWFSSAKTYLLTVAREPR